MRNRNDLKIFSAIRENDTTAILELLEDPNNINIRDRYGFTPLHWAAILGNRLIAEKLLEKGTDINAVNNQGETPLHWAAWSGKTDLVNLFLTKEGDINKPSNHGKTALEGAINFEHKDIIKLLLDHGAVVDSKWNAADYWKRAVHAKNLTQLKSLVDLGGVPTKEVLNTSLVRALFTSNHKIVEYLLQLGAEPDITFCSTVKMAILLLKYGADINKVDDDGHTLLHRAIYLLNSEMIEFALQHNADITIADKSGLTPLELLFEKYRYYGANLEKPAEIQKLFLPYLVNSGSEKEFIYLLKELLKKDGHLTGIDIQKVDRTAYNRLIMWLSDFISKEHEKEALQDFALKLVESSDLTSTDIELIKKICDTPNLIPLKMALTERPIKNLIPLLNNALGLSNLHLVDNKHTDVIHEVLNELHTAAITGPFSITPEDIQFDSSPSLHAAHLFRHLYSLPYPHAVKRDGIARYYHGMPHISRAAIYIPVLANLYRKYGNEAALNLTPEDIKLTQIAALLHDAGREAEGKDYWDKDSGILTYVYLKKIGIAHEKAKLFAEAVANKDSEESEYMELQFTKEGFEWINSPNKKNIYQHLIHDADCLDIIRVREHFDYEYLDFYKKIAFNDLMAFEDMEILIDEVTCLIEKNGDKQNQGPNKKGYYDCEEGYDRILADINNSQYFPMLRELYTPNQLLSTAAFVQSPYSKDSFDPAKGCEEKNIQMALLEGQLFARGIKAPSKINEYSKISETNAALELRKTARRRGTLTTTSKANGLEKQGNPNRSISMIGFKSGVFYGCGFLIAGPDPASITSVSKQNAGTGFAKKSSFRPTITTTAEALRELNKLKLFLKKQASKCGPHDIPKHVELTCNLEDYSAIFFSADPNSSGKPQNAQTPLLEAVFLQKEYERLHGKKLPIFNYSPLNNTIQLVPEETYKDEKLKEMWGDLCTDYIRKEFVTDDIDKLCELINKPNEQIKIAAMYKETLPDYRSADSNYNINLKIEINGLIQSELTQSLLDKLTSLRHYSEIFSFVSDIYIKTNYILGTEWIKEIFHSEDEAINIFLAIPSADRLEFVKQLGIEWFQQNFSNDAALACFFYENFSLDDYLQLPANLTEYGLKLLLHKAIKEANNDEVERLLKMGANLNATDMNGFKALHWATVCGNLELVKKFIAQGADILATNQYNESLLHLSAWCGHIELVKFLLEQGLDPNQVSGKNKTPISGAIEFGYPEIVDLLIKSGAKTDSREVPLPKLLCRYAREGNLEELAKWLNSAGPIESEIKLQLLNQIDLTTENGIHLLKLFLTKFEHIDFATIDTQWLYNTINALPNEIDLFIEVGLNLKSIDGFLLLQQAIEDANYVLAVNLLKHGAHPILEGLRLGRDVFSHLKLDFENRKKTLNEDQAQKFLADMFELFGQYCMENQLYDTLLFFYQNLTPINLSRIDFSGLNEIGLRVNIMLISALVIKPMYTFPWMSDDRKEQLIELYEELNASLEAKTHPNKIINNFQAIPKNNLSSLSSLFALDKDKTDKRKYIDTVSPECRYRP